MKRTKFIKRLDSIDTVMTEEELRKRISSHCKGEDDLPICMGELAELQLELTRHQRGKMDFHDFLQELSHVQWAVWTLQEIFGVGDETLRAAVQASFR